MNTSIKAVESHGAPLCHSFKAYLKKETTARIDGATWLPMCTPSRGYFGQRFRLDCDTTEAASFWVVGLELLLSAFDALASMPEPVCRPVPVWDNADAASCFCTCDALELCKVFPASDATEFEVCFVLVAIFTFLVDPEKGLRHTICGGFGDFKTPPVVFSRKRSVSGAPTSFRLAFG